MRNTIVPIILVLTALCSCKGPQKAVSYGDLYSEKPLTI